MGFGGFLKFPSGSLRLACRRYDHSILGLYSGSKVETRPNIKFPLSDKPQPWLDSVEEANHAGRHEEKGTRRNSPLNGHRKSLQNGYGSHENYHDILRDALGDELVR